MVERQRGKISGGPPPKSQGRLPFPSSLPPALTVLQKKLAMSVSMLGGAVPAGVPQPRDATSLASINAAAALRNYKLNPRIGESSGLPAPLARWLHQPASPQPACTFNAAS